MSGQMSKKNLFWGSACSKFAFPDWARVKCRQQRFLEHYDEAKPPWGSWAILLFKVWTGAAFICDCILHRLSVLLFVLLYSTQFPSPFGFDGPIHGYLFSWSASAITLLFSFIFFVSLSWKTGSKTQKVATLNVSCYANESVMPRSMTSLESVNLFGVMFNGPNNICSPI